MPKPKSAAELREKNREYARASAPCDLVLKGGAASGFVYSGDDRRAREARTACSRSAGRRPAPARRASPPRRSTAGAPGTRRRGASRGSSTFRSGRPSGRRTAGRGSSTCSGPIRRRRGCTRSFPRRSPRARAGSRKARASPPYAATGSGRPAGFAIAAALARLAPLASATAPPAIGGRLRSRSSARSLAAVLALVGFMRLARR